MAKSDKLISLGLMLAAFSVAALYIYFAHPFPPTPEFLNIDAVDYDTIGYNLYLGNGYCYHKGIPTSFRTPVYPVFLYLTYKVFGYNHTPVKYIQALLHGIMVMLLYLIGRHIFDRVTALIASSYIACYKPFLYINNMILSEPLFIFLVVLSIYLVIRIIHGDHVVSPMLTGIVTSLGAMCRTALVPFVFFFIPLIFFIHRYHSAPGSRRKKIRSLFGINRGSPINIIVIVFIFFILTASPWIIRNYMVQGEFLFTDTHGGWVVWQKYIPFYNYGHYFDNTYKKAEEKGFSTVKSTEIFRWIFEDNNFGVDATYDLLKREYPEYKSITNEFDVNRFYYEKAYEHIRKNPIEAAFNILKNGIKFFIPLITTEGLRGKYSYWFSFIMTFGIIGMYLSKGNWNRTLILHFTILNFLLVIMLSYAHNRFRFPADPAFALFAAYGIKNIYDRSRKLSKSIIFYLFVILINLILGQVMINIKLFIKNLIN